MDLTALLVCLTSETKQYRTTEQKDPSCETRDTITTSSIHLNFLMMHAHVHLFEGELLATTGLFNIRLPFGTTPQAKAGGGLITSWPNKAGAEGDVDVDVDVEHHRQRASPLPSIHPHSNSLHQLFPPNQALVLRLT